MPRKPTPSPTRSLPDEKCILVIYAQLPEKIDFFLVPRSVISPEMMGLLQEAHGKYANSDPRCNGLDFVQAATSPKPEWCDEEAPERWRCIFNPYRVQDEDLMGSLQIDCVVNTGFVL